MGLFIFCSNIIEFSLNHIDSGNNGKKIENCPSKKIVDRLPMIRKTGNKKTELMFYRALTLLTDAEHIKIIESL